MDAVEQEVFEPSRKQLTAVDRLVVEHGKVEVSVDAERKLVRVRTNPNTLQSRTLTFDENGDDVTTKLAGVPTEARLSLPVILVARLIGDGPTALAVEGVAGMEMPAFRLGAVLEAEIVAAIVRLLADEAGA